MKYQTTAMKRDLINDNTLQSTSQETILPHHVTDVYSKSKQTIHDRDVTALKRDMKKLAEDVHSLKADIKPVLDFVMDKSKRKKNKKSSRVESSPAAFALDD